MISQVVRTLAPGLTVAKASPPWSFTVAAQPSGSPSNVMRTAVASVSSPLVKVVTYSLGTPGLSSAVGGTVTLAQAGPVLDGPRSVTVKSSITKSVPAAPPSLRRPTHVSPQPATICFVYVAVVQCRCEGFAREVLGAHLAAADGVRAGHPRPLAVDVGLVAERDPVRVPCHEGHGRGHGPVDQPGVLLMGLQRVVAVDHVVHGLSLEGAGGVGRVCVLPRLLAVRRVQVADAGARVGDASRVALDERAPAGLVALEVLAATTVPPPAPALFAFGSGTEASAIRRTSSRVTAADPAAAPIATVTLPFAGAVKVTAARWA